MLRRQRWDAATKVSLAVQKVWSSEEPGANLMMTKLENTRRDLARSRMSRRGLEYAPMQVKKDPNKNEFGGRVLMYIQDSHVPSGPRAPKPMTEEAGGPDPAGIATSEQIVDFFKPASGWPSSASKTSKRAQVKKELLALVEGRYHS